MPTLRMLGSGYWLLVAGCWLFVIWVSITNHEYSDCHSYEVQKKFVIPAKAGIHKTSVLSDCHSYEVQKKFVIPAKAGIHKTSVLSDCHSYEV